MYPERRIDSERWAVLAKCAPTYADLLGSWLIEELLGDSFYLRRDEARILWRRPTDFHASATWLGYMQASSARTPPGSFPSAFLMSNGPLAHTYRTSEATASVLIRLFYRGRWE